MAGDCFLPGPGVIRPEYEVEHALEDEGRGRLPRVNPRAHQHHTLVRLSIKNGNTGCYALPLVTHSILQAQPSHLLCSISGYQQYPRAHQHHTLVCLSNANGNNHWLSFSDVICFAASDAQQLSTEPGHLLGRPSAIPRIGRRGAPCRAGGAARHSGGPATAPAARRNHRIRQRRTLVKHQPAL
jgi:hypothetical protein